MTNMVISNALEAPSVRTAKSKLVPGGITATKRDLLNLFRVLWANTIERAIRLSATFVL